MRKSGLISPQSFQTVADASGSRRRARATALSFAPSNMAPANRGDSSTPVVTVQSASLLIHITATVMLCMKAQWNITTVSVLQHTVALPLDKR